MTAGSDRQSKDISFKFVESLENNIKKVHEQFKFPKKIIFGKKDKEDFEKAHVCYACGCSFDKESEEKAVKDDGCLDNNFEKMDELFMNDKISEEEFKK